MYRTLYSPQGGRIILDGREVINMASNNYLGLANHPAVVAAAKEALEKYGVATTASRNICGNYPVHDELEEKLAKFKGVEATLVFNCGVTANSGLIPQLVGKGDFIYSDELNHGSIIDGCRLSGAKIKVFRHMDMAHLEELLQEPVEGKRLIITDGVFSMDGDLAPLPKMADLADQYNALLVVDDAHGDGVMGPAGRGTVDHFGLRDRIIIETGSLQGIRLRRRLCGRPEGVHRGTASQGKKLYLHRFPNGSLPDSGGSKGCRSGHGKYGTGR